MTGWSPLFCARLLPALGIVSQLACYTYVPATLDTLPQGVRVRALVTPEAERALLATFGVQQGMTLAGRFQGREGEQVNLLVPSVPMGTGTGSRPLYQQVAVAGADILRVDVRRLNGFRTGVALAAAGAAAAVIAIKAVSGGESTGPPPGPPPSESVRRWIVGISVSWP